MARLAAPLLALALLARAHATPTQACATAAATLATAVAAGGACADGSPGNSASACAAACTAAVAGYVAGCGSADFVDANVFSLLELGKGLNASANAACRGTFLTQARAFVGAAGNTDVCSNGVLYMGGAVENYGVCPTTGSAFAGACPADCMSLMSAIPAWCASTDLIRLPQLALQYKGIACTQPVCAVGTAGTAVGAAQAQLRLPSACLPSTTSGTTSSAAARAGAAQALAVAALAAAALALA